MFVIARISLVVAGAAVTAITFNNSLCDQALYEPESNPFLANSPWPMTHRSSYVQGSSCLSGPTHVEMIAEPNYAWTGLGNIALLMSPEYEDGGRVYWGSGARKVYKLDPNDSELKIYDEIEKPSEHLLGNPIKSALSAAYNFIDSEGTFFTASKTTILGYRDEIEGDRTSKIILDRSFTIPDEILGDLDATVGLSLTWDGTLLFGTRWGVIGAIDRYFQTPLKFIKLPGDDEELSNAFAVDEDGGIFVVTSKNMYRVQWTGSELTLDPEKGAWTADYDTGPPIPLPPRLGPGSGTSPSLMGMGDMDKFVVILDGASENKMVLFWRDEIPSDWEGLPGKDRRIAAEEFVDFGKGPGKGLSEQSVLVRGYGAVVVNNLYVDRKSEIYQRTIVRNSSFIRSILNFFAVMMSHKPPFRPYGMQKMEWDPVTRTLSTSWINQDISCPNGIPTMSEASNLAYCYGARGLGMWTIEAVNWDTGKLQFTKEVKYSPGPNLRYNSAYAGLQIGFGGSMIIGTAFGAVELKYNSSVPTGDSVVSNPGFLSVFGL